jgi:uncharacterized protein YcbX
VNELQVRLAELHIYPVKSCAGIVQDESLVIETGLELDRAWMVVDDVGEFLSQRELPQLALVQTRLRHNDLVVRAPGMLALHLALDVVEQPTDVRIWNDTVRAYDMGPLAAQWFSDYLKRKLRLVRFDPEQRRLSNRRATGVIEAENAFSDGYPLLVISQGSLALLNERLRERGDDAVTIERFRPNIVLDGLDAHGEDQLDEVRFETTQGPVRLKMVQPCVRCVVPDIDPETGVGGQAVGEVLSRTRRNARMGGGITFGMNAVILEGIDRSLRVGMTGKASIRFD